MDLPKPKKPSSLAIGTLFGLGAYAMWGLFPLYWKQLAAAEPLQILAHRIVWSFILTMILSLALGKGTELLRLLRERRRLLAMVAAGFLITANWGIYIWAVNSSRILESSMGYYLNPLVSVLLGSLVFKEKIDRGMVVACVVAAAGIAILVVSYGRLPWVALSLAFTFAAYGAIKKLVGLSALAGLAAETTVVFPLALAFLIARHAGGTGAFGNISAAVTVLLFLAGAVTAVPLMFYAEGVNRIPLSRMGFLQYISPTTQLSLGVLVYGERISLVNGLAFGFVFCALVIFALTRRKTAA